MTPRGVHWTGAGLAVPYSSGHLTVIKDGSRYKMWMSYVDTLLYLTSSDGVHFYAQGFVGGIEGAGLHVIEEDGVYKMWIAQDGGFRFATSPNGLDWTPRGISLAPPASGTWESGGMGDPCVVRDGSSLRMWYDGYDGIDAVSIGYATSP